MQIFAGFSLNLTRFWTKLSTRVLVPCFPDLLRTPLSNRPSCDHWPQWTSTHRKWSANSFLLGSSWAEWINSHQCTSWPFCPPDGLRFFIRRRLGLITVDFFLLLTTVLFFSFLFFVLGRFSWTWPHTYLPCSLSYRHTDCTNLLTQLP
jgi:hypothetical protein